MKAFRVQILYAFSKGSTGGNPAGVVLDQESLSHSQKQRIAARMGLSETAFVTQTNNTEFTIEFYTPVRRIDNCGHATVASFAFLKQSGRIKSDYVTVTNDLGRTDIFFKQESVFMSQPAGDETDLEPEDRSKVLKSLGCLDKDLSGDLEIKIVSTGNRFLLIPFQQDFGLAGILPQDELILFISQKYDLVGFYAFALPDKGYAATTRMFAPAYGIAEESATGMAAGPLASFLYGRGKVPGKNFILEQGRFMQPPAPSEIFCEIKGEPGAVREILIGGKARLGKQAELEI